MTSSDSTPALPPSLLARSQEAQVATSEANARKAAADAESSALTAAQARYTALVPDLTGVATNTVDDKSSGVVFSGLVTYSALNHAAEIIADRISGRLAAPAAGHTPAILVTTDSDLLTGDLLSSAVATGLSQLADFAGEVLEAPLSDTATSQPPADRGAADVATAPARHVEMLTAAADGALAALRVAGAGTSGAAAAGAGLAGAGLAGAALGPIGLAAAAVAAVPSIVSLFSSTTTVKSQADQITDLATTTAVLSAVSDKLAGYTAVHEDFRLAPTRSVIREGYEKLGHTRTALLFKQEWQQAVKNAAALELSRAQAQQDAATKAAAGSPVDPGVDLRVAEATMACANADAALSLIAAAVTSIDAFTTAINATTAGARSPLAIASLNELLHEGEGGGISFVLMVKGLGGQAEEYTKDRHIGFDTYTTLADASVSYMLYDTAAKKIISSGVANGVSSVHGRLGHPPTGLVGPNLNDAIDDQAADPQSGGERENQPPAPHHGGWRHLFGAD